MAVELRVPTSGESISVVQVGAWHKSQGEHVNKDDVIVEIESDKATVEVYAPESGTISEILKKTGEEAEPGEVIGYLEAGDAKAASNGGAGAAAAAAPEKRSAAPSDEDRQASADAAPTPEAEKEPVADAPKEPAKKHEPETTTEAAGEIGDSVDEARVMPSARRLMEQHGLDKSEVEASGPGGRVLKEDVQRRIAEDQKPKHAEKAREAAPAATQPAYAGDEFGRQEERVAMSPMRRRIASQLVAAQQNAALLTTFNEVDMSEVMALRNQYKDAYTKEHGIKLGFMSFFVKAAVEALKEFPAVNAIVDGTDIVYRNFYDVGIAVGGGKGLVVPILRNADRMSFAEIEKTIADFGERAQKNKITLEELKGGTFTISNGGIYGSLLSTPIVNPPQSGILGMHAIQERPVVRNGEIVARPMMYVAVTYDHRIVDGREAVSFLKRIKECIEEPSRILLEV